MTVSVNVFHMQYLIY